MTDKQLPVLICTACDQGTLIMHGTCSADLYVQCSVCDIHLITPDIYKVHEQVRAIQQELTKTMNTMKSILEILG